MDPFDRELEVEDCLDRQAAFRDDDEDDEETE